MKLNVLQCYIFINELLILVVQSKSYDRYSLYEIKPNNVDDLNKLFTSISKLNGINIWHTQDPTEIMVAPDIQKQFIDILQTYSFNYTVKIQDISRSLPRYKRKLSSRFKSSFSITFDKYYNHEMINEYLDSLPSKYPQLVEIINIGKSFEGRAMKVVRISTTKGHSRKPAIFIDGGIHAREWIAPAQVLFIIHNLLVNCEKYFELINDLDWYLLPVVNPDGYDYSFEDDRFWRKTRSYNGTITNDFCVGVDANRNWDFHFKEDKRSRDNCSENYGGPAPFSESETRNIRNFAYMIKNNLKLYITFHSYGSAILYPWAYTDNVAPDNLDELQQLAQTVKNNLKRRYKVGRTSKIQYIGSGESQDWFKGVLGVPLCYTIELPGGGEGGFDLPEDEIQSVVTDMFKGVTIFAEYVYNNFPPTN